MRILNNVNLSVYDTNPKLGMQPKLKVHIADSIPQGYLLGLLASGFTLVRPVYAGELHRIEYSLPDNDEQLFVTVADYMCENHKERFELNLSEALVTNGIIDNIDYPKAYAAYAATHSAPEVSQESFINYYKSKGE